MEQSIQLVKPFISAFGTIYFNGENEVFLSSEHFVPLHRTLCFLLPNISFLYRKTKCSKPMEQSVFIGWNKVFSAMN